MARSDLLLALVKAGVAGNRELARSTAEAIIAEEKSKQHHALADRLLRAVSSANAALSRPAFQASSSPSQDFIAEVWPSRQLEDLLLPAVCERACNQLIEEQRRSDLLRANGLEPRSKVLLAGPPGNGKTSLAEAIASALGVSLFVVRYEIMIGSFLGETASRLKKVFDYAKTTPCVLFFDEFDVVGKERGDIHETGEIKRVVSSLLLQMDTLPSYSVVIAATNHPELLDRAVWRRFQLRLELPAPSRRELARFFNRFQLRIATPLGYSSENLAQKLQGLSFAEAEEFCRDVLRQHVLSMGERPVNRIVADQLKLWSARFSVAEVKRTKRGRPSATQGSDPETTQNA